MEKYTTSLLTVYKNGAQRCSRDCNTDMECHALPTELASTG